MAAFVINLAKRILPALLVGSGLKLRVLPAIATRRRSPGFIGREWIETLHSVATFPLLTSPGFIGREWIETVGDE